MSLLESFYVALFCMAVVFVLLGCLDVLTRLFADAIRLIEAKANK